MSTSLDDASSEPLFETAFKDVVIHVNEARRLHDAVVNEVPTIEDFANLIRAGTDPEQVDTLLYRIAAKHADDKNNSLYKFNHWFSISVHHLEMHIQELEGEKATKQECYEIVELGKRIDQKLDEYREHAIKLLDEVINAEDVVQPGEGEMHKRIIRALQAVPDNIEALREAITVLDRTLGPRLERS